MVIWGVFALVMDFGEVMLTSPPELAHCGGGGGGKTLIHKKWNPSLTYLCASNDSSDSCDSCDSSYSSDSSDRSDSSDSSDSSKNKFSLVFFSLKNCDKT